MVMAWNILCSLISFFLHNKDILCYFVSFSVDSGRFQLTSTTSTFLLVEQSGVQCRLTVSTGLRLDRHHTPCSCGYDVGAVALKSKAFTFASFFFTFFLCGIIEEDCEHFCRSGSP